MSEKGCIQMMVDSIMVGVSRALLPKRRKWVIDDVRTSPLVYPRTQSYHRSIDREAGHDEVRQTIGAVGKRRIEGRHTGGGVGKCTEENQSRNTRRETLDLFVTQRDEIEYSPVICLKK